LIFTFLLARILVTAEYGTFVYARNWINLLLVFSVFGFAPLLVREVAAYKEHSSWSLMRGVVHWTQKYSLIFSLILSAALILGYLALSQSFSLLFYTLLAGILLMPIVSLIRIKKAAMQGLNYVVRGLIPEMVVHPVLFILLICLSYMFFRNSLDSIWAMGLYVISSVVALIWAVFQLKKYMPEEMKKATAEYTPKLWLLSALPLLIVDGAFIINSRADILILGGLKGSYWTGIYAIPCRVAELLTFILVAVNYALAPTISRLHSTKSYVRLQKIITKSARLAFFLPCPSL
jgi:O-antigen/teichoic acid export membrane protein